MGERCRRREASIRSGTTSKRSLVATRCAPCGKTPTSSLPSLSQSGGPGRGRVVTSAPPTGVLTDRLCDQSPAARFWARFFTTFRFEPAFFEQEILTALFDIRGITFRSCGRFSLRNCCVRSRARLSLIRPARACRGRPWLAHAGRPTHPLLEARRLPPKLVFVIVADGRERSLVTLAELRQPHSGGLVAERGGSGDQEIPDGGRSRMRNEISASLEIFVCRPGSSSNTMRSRPCSRSAGRSSRWASEAAAPAPSFQRKWTHQRRSAPDFIADTNTGRRTRLESRRDLAVFRRRADIETAGGAGFQVRSARSAGAGAKKRTACPVPPRSSTSTWNRMVGDGRLRRHSRQEAATRTPRGPPRARQDLPVLQTGSRDPVRRLGEPDSCWPRPGGNIEAGMLFEHRHYRPRRLVANPLQRGARIRWGRHREDESVETTRQAGPPIRLVPPELAALVAGGAPQSEIAESWLRASCYSRSLRWRCHRDGSRSRSGSPDVTLQAQLKSSSFFTAVDDHGRARRFSCSRSGWHTDRLRC